MNIQHESLGNKGIFFIEQEGKRLAEMTYVWAGDTRIIIDHTEVDTSLKGLGVGKKLVAEAVTFARNKKIKIMPLCPFAKNVFDKESSYADVLF